MSNRNGGSSSAALSQYWDDRVHDRPPGIGETPAFAESVDWFDAYRAQRGPAAVKERVRTRVIQPAPIARALQPLATVHPAKMPTNMIRPNHWVVMAVAAVLLIAVATGYLVLGRSEAENPKTIPAAAPSITASTPGTSANTFGADRLIWSNSGAPDAPMQSPISVQIAPDGNLWVQDNGTESVHVFTPDGAFVETWGESGSGEGEFHRKTDSALANGDGGGIFDPTGNYYVADTGNFRIQKFDQNHQFLLTWGNEGTRNSQFKTLSDLAIDSVGNVYALDSTRWDIQVFANDGSFLRKFGVKTGSGGPVRTGWRLSIDSNDVIWVSDEIHGRLYTYTLTGDLLKMIDSDASGNRLCCPTGIAFDDDGRLYVAMWGQLHVSVFDAETMRLILKLGGVGMEPPLLFSSVIDVTVDSAGNMYVVDFDNNEIHRIQKFMPIPDD